MPGHLTAPSRLEEAVWALKAEREALTERLAVIDRAIEACGPLVGAVEPVRPPRQPVRRAVKRSERTLRAGQEPADRSADDEPVYGDRVVQALQSGPLRLSAIATALRVKGDRLRLDLPGAEAQRPDSQHRRRPRPGMDAAGQEAGKGGALSVHNRRPRQWTRRQPQDQFRSDPRRSRNPQRIRRGGWPDGMDTPSGVLR